MSEVIRLNSTRGGNHLGVKIDKDGVTVTERYEVDGHKIVRTDSMSKAAFRAIYENNL